MPAIYVDGSAKCAACMAGAERGGKRGESASNECRGREDGRRRERTPSPFLSRSTIGNNFSLPPLPPSHTHFFPLLPQSLLSAHPQNRRKPDIKLSRNLLSRTTAQIHLYQIDGVPMCSPLPPVLADLFIRVS